MPDVAGPRVGCVLVHGSSSQHTVSNLKPTLENTRHVMGCLSKSSIKMMMTTDDDDDDDDNNDNDDDEAASHTENANEATSGVYTAFSSAQTLVVVSK